MLTFQAAALVTTALMMSTVAAMTKAAAAPAATAVQIGNFTFKDPVVTVKPWFNGKIDFAPPVPELADQGFPLAGGRLDSVEGRTVAAIVYKRRLHTVNLFVWRSAAEPGRNRVEDGFALREWSADGLRFAAISDIPAEELGQFESLYRQSANLNQPR